MSRMCLQLATTAEYYFYENLYTAADNHFVYIQQGSAANE